MAQKGFRYVISKDSAAVVGNTDIGYSAASYLNRDSGCTGINRIFAKLFYNRGRAFNNLSGGNKLCNILWQNVNSSHIFTFLSTGLSCIIYFAPFAQAYKAWSALQAA